MSDIVASGKALYWGTSEWSAWELQEAFEVAERHHLRKPVVEQPQYNLYARRRVEKEYAPIYDRWGIGLTTWSPLASGLLSGKYADGIPEGSRAALPGYEWLQQMLTDPERTAKAATLEPFAERLGVSTSQLAIAWCAMNPNVSSVITGASTVDQVKENMGALEALEQLTPELVEELQTAFDAAG
jgi:aryl-alcohol dehydrogenase-like predicted oxidoreductase